MPRFKQTLMGLSRLSDRVGGGGGRPYRLLGISGNTSSNAYSFSGHQAGDWLILVTWQSGPTPPNVAFGFTSVFTQSFPLSNQSARVQYQIASSSSPVSGNSGGSVARSAAISMRGIEGFGEYGFFDPPTTTATEFSAIVDFTPGSFVIGSSQTGSNISGVMAASGFGLLVPNLSPVPGIAVSVAVLDEFTGVPSFATSARAPTLSIEILTP